jgi:hypothetical protein
MTENQAALLAKLAGAGYLELCGSARDRDGISGYAVWDRKVRWSQGRTPRNAVAAADIEALLASGHLERRAHGAIGVTIAGLIAGRYYRGPAWQPADEGYRGEPVFP